MKIILDNGKEYNVAGASGIQAIAHALLKGYGLTDEQIASSQNTAVTSTVNEHRGRMVNTGSRIVLFNERGDNITMDCMPVGSERPPVKAIYISDTGLALELASQVVSSFKSNDSAFPIDCAGLYIWNKSHNAWIRVDDNVYEYYKYMAESADCIANATQELERLGASF